MLAGLSRQVEEQGFTIIPNVLTRDEVVRLVEDLAQLTLRRSKAGVRHVLGYDVVAELAREPRLLEIARAILGSEAFAFRATLFDKSPDANWLVVWHQDTALPLRERRETPGWGPWSVKESVIYAHAPESALCRVLALRVHLDDSTADNGPLRVLPTTHTQGVMSDDEVHGLTTQISPVECLVAQGGVVAMRPLLVHSSSKSHVQAARRVLHIEYAASAVLAEGLELTIA
jgi:ectoine hydroxylase-related dioxygenase (phytanoyl-CoA dioxygenase family)